MATIHKDIALNASADAVWAAVRDVGAPHQRLVPGVLTATRLEGGARIVTFADGREVRELIVTIDDERRRFAYAAVGGRAAHHNASMQVMADGAGRCRLVWITDVLPDEIAPAILALVDAGARAMAQTLQAAST